MVHFLFVTFINNRNKLHIVYCLQVFPDSLKALEGCSALGLKLGVVSNFDSRLREILHSCGLLSHFSFLITSEEAGAAKPDPVVFERALQKCDAPAASVAHIGDHYVNDYVASRSVGIHGFLLDRRIKPIQVDVPPEYRLRSLEELPSRLQLHMIWGQTVQLSKSQSVLSAWRLNEKLCKIIKQELFVLLFAIIVKFLI